MMKKEKKISNNSPWILCELKGMDSLVRWGYFWYFQIA